MTRGTEPRGPAKGPPPPPMNPPRGGTAGRRPQLVHDIKRVRGRRQLLIFTLAAVCVVAWSAGLVFLGISIGRLQGAVDCIAQQIGRPA
jgi:hypothetical protein